MKLDHYQILREPRVTEKSVYQQNDLNAYTFQVHPRANKQQIKAAVQGLFAVQVVQVRTVNCRGKARRTRMGSGSTAAWKKAIVTIADGESIEGV